MTLSIITLSWLEKIFPKKHLNHFHMTYTETTTTSYVERLGNSIKGIFFGILFIIWSIVLLSWNEGRTIDTTTGLAEGQKLTVEGNVSPINTALEWKLVHINGKADTTEILMDDIFRVQKNAIKLIRTVEMYQWKEISKTRTHDNVDGSETKTTTYTYDKIWSKESINSSSFHESWHENPVFRNLSSTAITSTGVKIGDMQLSSNFVNQMDNEESILLEMKVFQKWRIFGKLKKTFATSNISMENNAVYIWMASGSLSVPDIGDLRVSFSAVYPAEVSVIWQQQANNLVSYKTKSDMSIALLQYGNASIEQMYTKANSDNIFIAWILRWVGLLLMFIGFNLLFWLIVMIAKIIPFIADMLSIGTGLISLLLTLVVWWWTILIAWLFVRPLISVLIWVVVVWTVFMILKSKKRRGNGGGMENG